MRFLSWRPGQAASRRICEDRVRADCPESSGPRGPARVGCHLATGLRRLSVLRRMGTALALGLFAATGAQAQVACTTANTDGAYVVPSDWTLKPSGLAAGTKFRLLFVTSTTNSGRSTDIATYNDFVQTRAKAGHSTISDSCGNLFKVVGSTASVNARANTDSESTDTDALIYWLNGAKAADNYGDFYDGSWDSGAARSEAGSLFDPAIGTHNREVWTGTSNNGATNEFPLGDSEWPVAGDPRNSPFFQFDDIGQGNKHLYGLSPVFEVASPGVSVTPTLLEVDEGDSVTYTVVLDTEPSHDVVIAVASGDTAVTTVSPPTLTFSTTNWNSPQQVTVTAVDNDDEVAAEIIGSTIHTVTSSDTNYNAITVDAVAVSISDDDGPGVTVSLDALTVIRERTATYNIVLNTAPTGDVVITPTSSATAKATVSPATLTFTSSNWNEPQPVTVTGVALGSASISHQVTTSDDTTNYPTNMSIGSVAVTIEGLALELRYSVIKSLANAPEGSTIRYGEFYLYPQRALGAGETVTVPLSFTGGTLGTDFTVSIDPDHGFASATLSASTVTITGPGQSNLLKLRLFATDDVDTVDEVVTVSVGAATSTGGGPVTPVKKGNGQITLLDDDVSQSPLTVEFTRGAYSLDEFGGPAEPVLQLSAVPRTDIAVTVTVTDGTAVRGEDYVGDATRTVTFPAGGGSGTANESFQIKIVDDDEFEPDETFTVAIDTGSLPAGVTGKTGGNLQATVTIFSEDPPGVTVTPAALEVTEGATATYDVVLDTAPTGNVVITPTSSATAKATVSPATLTFTSSNWNQAQQVTVNGVAAGSASISHTVTTSADTTNYPTSMSIDPVAVTVTGPPVISITGGSALVEGANATFTVTSTPAPATDLTVKLSVADFADSDFLAAENEGEKSVTIPAGRSSVVYKFPTVADSKAEVAGDVSVTLLDGTGYTLNSDASKASIKILSRDKATLTFSSATATATEGAGAVTITASLDHTPDTELLLGDPSKLFPGRKKPADISTSFGFTGTKLDPDFPFTFSYDDDNVDRPDREIILDLARSALLSEVDLSNIVKRALVELGTQASMTLTLIDNDPTAVTLARVGSGAVNEGGTAEFTVTLGRALVAGEIIDVPLSVSGAGVTTDDWSLALKTGAGRNTGVVLSGETTATPSLRFSGAAAETARLVLTATPDKVTETGGETLSVALGPDDATANGFDRTSLATNVGGGADPDVSADEFTLTVNEVPGVTVTETGGSTTVSEDGTVTDSYEVVLDTAPSANVTIVFASDDTDVATVDTNTLTFTPGNWNEPQSVTVTGVDDDIDQSADRTVNISHVATSDDTAYNGILVASVSVTVSDDDMAGVTVTETEGGTTVSEDGTVTDSYEVVLDTAPSANVTIVFASDDTDVATVDTNTLTFTPGNWDQPQSVTVTGVDDDIDQSTDRTVSISHVATSEDTAYGGIEVASVSVTVEDDDEAGVTVTETEGATAVSEDGTVTDSYEVVLTSEPTQDVTIVFASDDTDVATVDTNTLTFTPGNWDQPQTVTVTGVDDDIDQSADRTVNISHVATSDDTAYNGILVASVSVTVSDDDMAGVTVTETEGGTTVSEDGTVTDSYEVVLDTAPSANVAIAVTSDDTDVATVDSDTLTFTPGNWNEPQSVTVTGVDDDIDQSADRTVSISHVAASEDPNYERIEIDGVDVTVLDDDMPAIGFEDPVSRTRETAGQHAIALSLDPVPGQNITLAYSIGVESTATQDSDFTIVNAGRVSVLAGASRALLPLGIVDDTLVEGDETVILTLENGSDYSPGEASQHVLTITDDDNALAERVVRPALTRFGRTVGEQVLDAVTDRLGATRTPGFEGRLAGEALPRVTRAPEGWRPAGTAEDGSGTRALDSTEIGWDQPGAAPGSHEDGSGEAAPRDLNIGPVGSDGASFETFRAWLSGERKEEDTTRALTGTDFVTGTSFALTSETENGAALAFWGRGAQSGFSGRAGDLGLEGEVTSFMLGADQARDDWLFGLMLSRSRGEIDYTLGAASGEMETDLTALVPYMGWDVSDRLSVWGAAGLGSGDMRLRPEDGSEFRTDIDWGMAAAGADGALGSVAALGGAELRWLADALWTRTTSDAVLGLEATSGSTTRLRLGLESRWERALASGATVTPRLEIGLRHDGGDAETGFGLEIGGGVEFTDPSRGLSLGLEGRTLALHQDGNFEDWGLALDLAYDPTPETKRGFAARLSHTFGGASSGGVDALLGPRLFPEASPTGGGDRSWSVEAAYGVSRGRGRVGSPYTTITAAGSGSATGARLGYRIEPDADHAADVNLDFWTEPPTAANDRASGGATLQWKW